MTTSLTTETLDTQFAALIGTISTYSKDVRSLQDELKGIHRTFRQLDKQTRQRKKKPQAKLSLSKELEKFLSLDHLSMYKYSYLYKCVDLHSLEIKSTRCNQILNRD